MMQAKENQQQFNTVKENLLPLPNTKGIQGKMAGLKENGNGNGKRQSLKPIKNEIVDGKIKKLVPKQNSNSKANKKARRPSDVRGQKVAVNNKGKESLKPVQQSLKPVQQSLKPVQQSLKPVQQSLKPVQQSLKPAQQSLKPVQPSKPAGKKEPELDFVIFCDENDELAIKAVEKENADEQRTSDANRAGEKKKGLAERNVKPQQSQNVLVNLQSAVNQQVKPTEIKPATIKPVEIKQAEIKPADVKPATKPAEIVKPTVQSVQQSVQQLVKQSTMTSESSITIQQMIAAQSSVEIIKEAVVPIDNLTLDETLEEIDVTVGQSTIKDQSTIENKENDPTLMSIDLSKVDEEADPLQQHDQYKDVSGDMCCREFSNEIYLYMLERELKFLPDPAYMSKQPEINSKMRAMLVDWLIDVGIEYELENETVFLAISYIDQFLSSLTISLQNFQLLGTAALFIASKYEEIYPPELKDFIFVTDDAYTKLQMLSMEKVILKSLSFNISPPTIFYFLKYFLTKLSLPVYVQHFAEYLCFLSLLHIDPFLSFSPSDIAISSIILALHTYTLTDVVSLDEFKQLTRVHFCKDEEGKLSDAKAIHIRQSCVNAMYKMQKGAADDAQQAVYTKYSSDKYLSVATVELADEVPLVENFFN